jgi:cytochrome c-type biogenesis protein CcmE
MMRPKFIVGGGMIVIAMIYLIISSTAATAQYFLTVDELNAKTGSMQGRDVRVSGAVIGDTIAYDNKAHTLSFAIANVPGDNRTIEAQGGLAKVLHDAVNDPQRTHLKVIYNGPKPDLLRDEAQAILTGQLDENGNFIAQEVLLKCPTRYEEALPSQISEDGR